MSSLRLIAWNCHHGSLSKRLAELAPFVPAIVFLQECKPTETLALLEPCLTKRVNAQKAIALASLNADYHLEELTPRANRGRAVIGAAVSGPVSFTEATTCRWGSMFSSLSRMVGPQGPPRDPDTR